MINGHLDGIFDNMVAGWAWNPRAPQQRLKVSLVEGNRILATQMANEYRNDLEAAGIGDGKHHFRIPIPDNLTKEKSHTISVVAAAEGKEFLIGKLIDFVPQSEQEEIKGRTLEERLRHYQEKHKFVMSQSLPNLALIASRDFEAISQVYGTETMLAVLYTYLLQRPIDPNAMQSFRNSLAREEISIAQLISGILASEEMRTLGFGHLVAPQDPEYPLLAWL